MNPTNQPPRSARQLADDETVANAFERRAALRKEPAKLLHHPALDDPAAEVQD